MAFSEGLKEEFKNKPLTQEIWDTILDFEKSWIKNNPTLGIPTNKILHYFGAENICKLYGCTVIDEEIAKVLIKKAFEK